MKYIIASDEKSLRSVLNALDSLAFNNSIVAVDTETDGVKRFSSIYGIGVAASETHGYYVPIRNKTGEYYFNDLMMLKIKNTFKTLLTNSKIIGHNLSFDIIKLEDFLEISLCDYVYADTILLWHLLNEEGPFGLKELGAKFFGQDATKEQNLLIENVKQNGGKTTKNDCEYFKADTDILGQYCIQDVILTYKLYNLLWPKVKEEGLDRLWNEEVLPLYKLVTIPMNKHGLRINLEKIHNLKKEIQKDIEQLEDKILFQIKPLIQEFETNLLNEHAPINRRGLFAKEYAKYVGLDESCVTKTACKNLTPANVKQEEFKKFILGEIENFADSRIIQERVFFQKYPEQRHIFNLRSKHHLKYLFFERLNLDPISTTDKGSPQVNDDFLDFLLEINNPAVQWIQYLKDLNKLEKLRGTYIEGIIERLEGEYVYPSMLQFGTTSGRFSSKNPNVQNLPRPKEEGDDESEVVKKYNNSIREIFIPIDGYVFVDADYSALEPRCFAHCSGDEGLRNIFRKGEDMYSSLAIKVFHVQDASPFKADANFLGKKHPDLRQKMKVVALAAAYGATEYRIAKLLNCNVDEAKDLLDDYFNAYPNLAKYVKKCHFLAKTKGIVETEFGRKRHLLTAKKFYDIHKDRILDKAYFRKNGLMSEYLQFKNYLNNSTNFPIQGLAAHIVNRAMIKIAKEIKKRKLDATIVLQVHDQIVVESNESCAQECLEIVKTSMESVVELSVPLITEPKLGYNLKDSH